MRKLIVTAMLVVSAPAFADSRFDTEMALIKEKADFCIVSSPRGDACKDFESFTKYVMKGSTAVFIDFHFKNGDITPDNMKAVTATLESMLKATEHMSGQ